MKFKIGKFLIHFKRSKMKTVNAVLNGLKDGAIKLNTLGHNHLYSDELTKRNLIDSWEYDIDKSDLKKSFSSNGTCPTSALLFYSCSGCGEVLEPLLVKDTLVLIGQYSLRKAKLKKENLNLDMLTCKFKKTGVVDNLKTEINIPTGDLWFANYFYVNDIFEIPFNSSNVRGGINSKLGELELMKYLAKKNVGYCQMGNMAVKIHINKTKDEIIITNLYSENDTETTIDGFKEVGEISLSMWRLQFADKSVLKKYGQLSDDEQSYVTDGDRNEEKETYTYSKLEDTELIQIKVKKGTWVIEHYYGLKPGKIYSKLYLKKL